MKKKNEKCKTISHFIIFLDIIFCIAFPQFIDKYNEIIFDIGLGIFISSISAFAAFIITKKPKWILNTISELRENFDPIYCITFIICATAGICSLAFFIIKSYAQELEVLLGDFELVKDLLKELNNPEYLYMIVSFGVSHCILSLSYNVANETFNNE